MIDEQNPSAADCEIVTTRIFKVPRERLFKAWTDPVWLAQWWGPKGFTSTFHEFNLQQGGVWRFTMHGPDGTDYENKSVFVEIVEPERLVFDHVSGHLFRVIATFEDEGGETKVTFRMIHNTPEECEKVKVFAVEANEQNFDRLEAVLEKMTHAEV